MGDDYKTLCIDMLAELIELCEVEIKPAKKINRLNKLVTNWQRRKLDFESYRVNPRNQ